MHKWKIVCIMMVMILITGCWDKVEIDKRAFVAVICIDKFEAKDGDGKNVGETKKAIDEERNRYMITIAYPNTGVIAGKGEGEPKFVYTSVGKNFYDILDNLSTRLGRRMHFRHTKAIVIGEGLAEDEKLFREVLDTIERSPQIGRKVNLIITPGKAKKIIDTNTKDEAVLGLFIRELVEQNLGTARLADADFGYILRSLHESQTAITPRIFSSKDEFKIAGAAVLKDFKMVGYLGEEDTRNLMFMFDKVQSSVIHIEVDDLIMPIHITDSKTKKKVYEKDGSIYTSFHIKAEGDLGQHLFEVRDQPLDDEYIQKLERTASKYLEEQIDTTYKKIQKDFGADLIQAGEYLRKHEPDLWKEVKDDWSQIFPKTKVEAHVDMKIRRIGVTQ
ncbi:Ger(x)C family spore germination protein [Crassaminicella profunda]|uniref:Ger(x)C family spore germination protein n=1 Tax=Crassaminicella profunda TaxID=1286698 RepID=UPI001CA69096|nr:Ger(x)C family spore germination protein [Crassaminicella profunda]QZY55468.1 Ger(x)C family spore germination protein [Crassaminicella profunda]